jgi:hypothetical protein
LYWRFNGLQRAKAHVLWLFVIHWISNSIVFGSRLDTPVDIKLSTFVGHLVDHSEPLWSVEPPLQSRLRFYWRSPIDLA